MRSRTRPFRLCAHGYTARPTVRRLDAGLEPVELERAVCTRGTGPSWSPPARFGAPGGNLQCWLWRCSSTSRSQDPTRTRATRSGTSSAVGRYRPAKTVRTFTRDGHDRDAVTSAAASDMSSTINSSRYVIATLGASDKERIAVKRRSGGQPALPPSNRLCSALTPRRLEREATGAGPSLSPSTPGVRSWKWASPRAKRPAIRLSQAVRRRSAPLRYQQHPSASSLCSAASPACPLSNSATGRHHGLSNSARRSNEDRASPLRPGAIARSEVLGATPVVHRGSRCA